MKIPPPPADFIPRDIDRWTRDKDGNEYFHMTKNTDATISANIATRKALGMSASEYAGHIKTEARKLHRKKQVAIRNAVHAGAFGTESQIDAALATCRKLGIV